jgi:hypothetical protein
VVYPASRVVIRSGSTTLILYGSAMVLSRIGLPRFCSGTVLLSGAFVP